MAKRTRTDRWEYKDAFVLWGSKPGDPILRVGVRGNNRPGDSTWTDLTIRGADDFASTVFVTAGYEVCSGAFRDLSFFQRQAKVKGRAIHCMLYQAVSSHENHRRLHTYFCIWQHDAPVRVRATQELPLTKAIELARWLAPRLGWELTGGV